MDKQRKYWYNKWRCAQLVCVYRNNVRQDGIPEEDGVLHLCCPYTSVEDATSIWVYGYVYTKGYIGNRLINIVFCRGFVLCYFVSYLRYISVLWVIVQRIVACIIPMTYYIYIGQFTWLWLFSLVNWSMPQ